MGTLASAEASVGFSGDDANIWGAIAGEFSEKGENTGPVTPGGTSHYLPGGADCRTHGQCKSGFCRRGTCTADDDWRNQDEAAVGAMKSCDVDGRTDPSSACPGDQMCTCENVYVGGGQQRPRCFCATPTLASAEASVGFSGDDANIWGAIE